MQEPKEINGNPPTPKPPPPAPSSSSSSPPAAPSPPPGPPIPRLTLSVLTDSQSQTEIQTQTQAQRKMDELPHSPLRSGSLLRSDEPEKPAAVEKYYSPLTSPLPPTPPKNVSTTDDLSSKVNKHSNSHVISFNRAVREGATQSALVVAPARGEGGVEGGVFGKRERKNKGVRFGAVEEIVGRSKRDEMVRRVALALRLGEFVLCLISFSIMASDKTQGWSGDSFDRYKEYRFCLSVNIIAFVYAGFQAFDLAYHLVTGNHVLTHQLRYQFDFIMDQILAYLLISASSAAATRVVDWQSNWGKDEFTVKASASVTMSFLAFFAFAFSALISGYNICNRDFT
ncbi:hypothetical protein Ancab_039056 [Ancistrocladus abbreviatus]